MSPEGGEAGVGPDHPMYEPRLASGVSVRFALFPDPNAPVISQKVDQAAGRLYARLRQDHRELLMCCDGVSLNEARRILAEGGIEITLITRTVEINRGGRYRIDSAVTGITPLSDSIRISRPGEFMQLAQGICYLVDSPDHDHFYLDLPPGASFKANVGLRDVSAEPFVQVDPTTNEPIESGDGGVAGVVKGVSGGLDEVLERG